MAAACLIDKSVRLAHINDSKKLSKEKREEFFHIITNHRKICYGVGVVDHQKIDEINIYQATLLAMKIALDALQEVPELLLVDGMKLLYKEIASEKIIGGDGRSQAIAAASIIAKVTRDEIMLKLHEKYPKWGFDRHKGYPTEEHFKAIKQFGLSPVHRRSYKPCGGVH